MTAEREPLGPASASTAAIVSAESVTDVFVFILPIYYHFPGSRQGLFGPEKNRGNPP